MRVFQVHTVVMCMSGKWVQDCKKLLDEVKKASRAEGEDRLDMVRLIRFTLFALQRSVTGWMEWINNPDIMAEFSLDELKNINKNLAQLVCPFIEYDAKITGKTERELVIEEEERRREPMARSREQKDFYV